VERVRIAFPETPPLFETVVPVRIGDINYGGHMGNDAFLSVMHEARMQWLRRHGCDELRAGGVSLIMADVRIAYKAEAFYGDELLVRLYVADSTDRSFSLLYRISTLREGRQTDVVHAGTTMVCFDYATRSVARMTDALGAMLGA